MYFQNISYNKHIPEERSLSFHADCRHLGNLNRDGAVLTPPVVRPLYHHVKAHVLTISKMWYFLVVGLFKGELLLLKVNEA